MAQIINSWQEGTMPIMAWSFNSKIILILSATEYSENVINIKNTKLWWEAWNGLLWLRTGIGG
jgi:hypothetical protein